MYFSIDGLFGLCRKKVAGKSVRPPLYDGKYFEVQSDVDQFVNEYPVKPDQRTVVSITSFCLCIMSFIPCRKSVMNFLVEVFYYPNPDIQH